MSLQQLFDTKAIRKEQGQLIRKFNGAIAIIKKLGITSEAKIVELLEQEFGSASKGLLEKHTKLNSAPKQEDDVKDAF